HQRQHVVGEGRRVLEQRRHRLERPTTLGSAPRTEIEAQRPPPAEGNEHALPALQPSLELRRDEVGEGPPDRAPRGAGGEGLHDGTPEIQNSRSGTLARGSPERVVKRTCRSPSRETSTARGNQSPAGEL